MSESEEETSLSTLYTHAHQLLSQLENLQSSSSSYQSKLHEAITTLQSCKHAASRLSLFSPNESLDDLTTSSLQYLTLDASLGDLYQRQQLPPPSSSPSKPWSGLAHRRAILLAAQSAYADFLGQLDSYGLLGDSDERSAWKRFNDASDDERLQFTVMSPSTNADPSARRDAKIARLRREKALKAQLDALRADPGVAVRADDDAVRDLRLAELRMRAFGALAALEMIAMELRVLADAPDPDHARANPDPRMLADDRTRSRGAAEGYSDRLDPSRRQLLAGGRAGPILDARGKPMQPFVLLDKREDIRRGVFRPGHRLPTMSIDEYLEEERRRGGIIEGGGEPPVVEPNEDDLEAADRETMKQREWDEFKEENPRGSGNTINRG